MPGQLLAREGLLLSFPVASKQSDQEEREGHVLHIHQCWALCLTLDSHCPLSLHPSPVPIVQMMKLRLREAKCLAEPRVTGKTGT